MLRNPFTADYRGASIIRLLALAAAWVMLLHGCNIHGL